MGVEIGTDIYAAVQTLGEDTVMELAQGLNRARRLHPEFAINPYAAVRVVLDEADELNEAVKRLESPDRQHAEALDTAVTAIRFMKLEWLPKFGAEAATETSEGYFRPAEQVWGEESLDGRVSRCVDTNPENVLREDPVNHPSHYTAGAVECIDAIQAALTPEEFAGYCKGSIMKYTWRERHKGGNESLRKGKWYMDRLLGSREG